MIVRRLARIASLVAFAARAVLASAQAPGDWRADLEALESGLARNYANFEYTLVERRIDLPAIAERARAALDEARDDAARRAAFEQLLRAFRDPHVRIAWPSAEAAGARPGNGPGPACPADLAALATHPGVAFARLPGYRALDDADGRALRAGVLRRPGADPVGVLRIPIFLERAYPWCADAARAAGFAPDAACDEACENAMHRHAVRRANEAIDRTLRALERAGARRIVVDVTDNGGGTDWAEAAARVFAGPLASSRIGMLRHPAWVAWADGKLDALDAAIAGAPPARTPALRAAARRLADARKRLVVPCDLGAAWSDRALALGERPLPCTTLVADAIWSTGLVDGRVRPAGDDGLLDKLAWYGPPPARATRLPIDVLVNEESHSAAEQFAAVLRDNGRARVVGVPTAGAGCGTFTGRGTSFTLPATGARVHVPDCVRLRADGSNERRGIVPDRIVPWAPSDSAWQRANKAAAAILALP